MKKTLSFLFICFCALSVKAQVQFAAIDVQHYTFAIRLNDQNDTIKGKATVSIKFLKDVDAFQLNLVKTKSDGKGMLVSAVKEEGKDIPFVKDSDVVNVKVA